MTESLCCIAEIKHITNHLYFNNGEGNGNPLQCSCLENPRDGGAWWAAQGSMGSHRIGHDWSYLAYFNKIFKHNNMCFLRFLWFKWVDTFWACKIAPDNSVNNTVNINATNSTLKIVKMLNFMLCIFYPNRKKMK